MTGIYKIESNVKPTRFYIGSAINIQKRKREHLHQLKENTHHNPKLQAHYNKYGKEDLLFSVLLGCDIDDLIKTEQYFIDFYKPWFNINPIAGSCLGQKRSKESCEKSSKRMKGNIPWNKGMKMTKDHCDNLRKSHKGQIAWNKGLKGFGKGRKMTEEQNRRNSLSKTGDKNPMFGRTHSEMSNNKRSESLKKTWAKRKEKIYG